MEAVYRKQNQQEIFNQVQRQVLLACLPGRPLGDLGLFRDDDYRPYRWCQIELVKEFPRGAAED